MIGFIILLPCLIIYGCATNTTGCVSGNCENGYGTYKGYYGDKYVGYFKGRKAHGKGTKVTDYGYGDKYVGDWHKNYMHGQGTYVFTGGNKYVGGFKNSKQDGQGTLTYAEGSKYVGEWKNGKKHGQGTFTLATVYPDCDPYIKSGDQYKGRWQNDKPNGHGVLIKENNEKFEGEFVNCAAHGLGYYSYSSGKVIKGIWEYGTRVKVLTETSTEEIHVMNGTSVETLNFSKHKNKKKKYNSGHVSDNFTNAVRNESRAPQILSQVIQLSHTGFITSVAFSHNGSYIVTGGTDKTIKIWNTQSKQLIRTITAHKKIVKSVVFAPDDKYLLSAGDDSIRLLDAYTGETIRIFEFNNRGVSFTVAFSKDGNYVMATGLDEAKVWHAQSGDELMIVRGHSGAAFSPDSQFVVVAGNDRIKRHYFELINIRTGETVRTFKHHSNVIKSLMFSPDGQRIVSGSHDKKIKLWNVRNGQRLRTLKGHTANIEAVVFSPNGTQIASASLDGTIRLWDVSSGNTIRIFKGKDAYSVAFSPNGRYLIAGVLVKKNNVVKMWNVSTGKKVGTFQGLMQTIQSVSYSLDRRYGVFGSSDNTIKVWDLATGQVVRTLIGHSDAVNDVAFSLDGKHIISASSDSNVHLWNIDSGNIVRTFNGHVNGVRSLALSSNGRYLVTGGNDHSIKLWDINTGNNIYNFSGHLGSVVSVAFSSNGKYIVSGSYDRTIKIWDVHAGHLIRTMTGHTSHINSITISPNNKFIVSGSADKTIKVWELNSGSEIRTFYNREYLNWGNDWYYGESLKGVEKNLVLNVFPDNRVVLGGFKNNKYIIIATLIAESEDDQMVAYSDDRSMKVEPNISEKTVKLYDPRNGEIIDAFERGDVEYNINEVTFSHDSRYIASGDQSGVVKIWDLQTGQKIQKLKGHLSSIFSTKFSPNGRNLLTSSLDNTVRLWETETGKEIAQFISLSDDEWLTLTSDGYYNRSPEERGSITFVANSSMDIYTPDQFESYFFKPDIIRGRLAGNANFGKPTPKLIAPPAIKMVDHMQSKQIRSGSYLLKLNANSQNIVTTVRIFVNSKPVLEKAVNAKQMYLKLNIPLFSGANRITAIAYDVNGFSSSPQYVDVISEQPGQARPNLYIFAIGISDYPKLADNWQLDFAHTDAKALIKTLHKQEGKLFGNVKSSILTNKQATPAKIEEMLDALSAISDNDIAVIFMAGHGTRSKDGTFYFLTPNGDFDNPEKGGITWDLFGEKLAKIKGRTLLFLDACHSGSISTETIAPNNELAAKFFKGQTGGVMVFSASKGRQSSLESPDLGGGFGFFTYALTQGLGKKSKHVDTNKNGFVEFMELVNYVKEFVNKETDGMQTPWLSRKELFGDLPIAKVN